MTPVGVTTHLLRNTAVGYFYGGAVSGFRKKLWLMVIGQSFLNICTGSRKGCAIPLSLTLGKFHHSRSFEASGSLTSHAHVNNIHSLGASSAPHTL